MNQYKLKELILGYVKNQKLNPEIAATLLKNITHNNENNYTRANKNIKENKFAIIGIAGRFADAQNIHEFWTNLIKNKSSITSIPSNRLKDIQDFNIDINNTRFFKGGFIPNIDLFDEKFFRISPKEAQLMDPKQRIFLEIAYHALEDAGYTKSKIYGSNTGVFVGVDNSVDTKFSYLSNIKEKNLLATTGNSPSILASRISYILNLKGPSVLIDTACSSSLVSVHYACNSIKNKECKIAIAGGINLFELPIDNEVMTDIENKEKKLRAFDSKSSGTTWGEGGGAIILKSYDQAIKDGDRIYAIINSTYINSDGASNGITAPNQSAQTKLITEAWNNANISPEKISYIETHGTGTPLGDPIEFKGLTKAFSQYTKKRQFCGIGSIKPNIGHCVGASGIASFIKLILSIYYKTIPATINFEEPNSFINFPDSPLYINTQNKKWDDKERYAGINSFGFSGTNCHILLSNNLAETTSDSAETQKPKEDILCLSAIDNGSLKRVIESYITYLEEQKELNIFDFSYTNNTFKTNFEKRKIFPVYNKTQLLNDLKRYSFNEKINTKIPDSKLETAFNYMQKNKISWTEIYNEYNVKKVSIPNYPFKKNRHWINDVIDENEISIINSNKKLNSTEYKLSVIWAKLFGLKVVDLSKNDFFSLGGDSIIASSLKNQIKKTFNKEVSFSDIYNNSNILSIARLLEKTKNSSEDIPLAHHKPFYPVPYNQQQIYVAHQRNPYSTTYNVPICLEIKGKISYKQLESSLEKLVERHTVFRTNFLERDNDIIQIINNNNFSFKIETISEYKLKETIKSFQKPFNLQKDSLLRAKLLKVSEQKHYLLIDTHHIIADGFSIPIIERDLLYFYNNKPLSPLDIQFYDYSEWLNNKTVNSSQKKFWKKEIGENPRESILPFEGNKLEKPVPSSNSFSFKIPKYDFNKRDNQTSDFTMFIAAIHILLYKYTGNSNIVVGSPFLGRNNKKLEDMVGMFIQTLPIISDISTDDSIRTILNKLNRKINKIKDYQNYAPELINSILENKLDNKEKYYQVLLSYQNSRDNVIHNNDLKFKNIPLNTNNSKFPISISVFPELEHFTIDIQYQETIVNNKEIKTFSHDFKTILSTLNTINLDTKIAALNFDNKRYVPLKSHDDSYQDSYHNLLRKALNDYKSHIALEYKSTKITYKTLNKYIKNGAAFLNNIGINRQEKIAILLENSVSYIISILSVLEHNSIFIPLDIEAPLSRNLSIIKKNNIKYLITYCDYEDVLPNDITIIKETFYKTNGEFKRRIANPEDIAYIIHTSGTTGEPKGVPISHYSLASYSTNIVKSLNKTKFTKSILTSSICFDLGYTSIFVPLLNGGTVIIEDKNTYIDSKKLANIIRSHNITYLKLTPSLFTSFNPDDFINCQSLDTIIFGGEVPTSTNIKKFSNVLPKLKFANHYGPTEATIGCITKYILEKDVQNNTYINNIGCPMNNTRALILNKNFEIMPKLIKGELYISGPCLTPGYTNRKDLNKTKFITLNGCRFYATGDLAKYNEDTSIQYCGRKDDQIKHMGYRIELSEITRIVLQIENVKQAATIFYEQSILLFFTGNIHADNVMVKLKDVLPMYMVPNFCYKIIELPLKSNGKLNELNLIQYHVKEKNTSSPNEVGNKEEYIISNAWSRTLNTHNISNSEDFFKNGGNSLKALQLVNFIRKSGYNIEISDVYEQRTIKNISKVIKEEKGESNIKTESGYYKTTPNQEWIIKNFYNTINYQNLSFTIESHVDLDLSLLNKTLNILVNHHDILKTKFKFLRQKVVKPVIYEDINFKIKFNTSNNFDSKERERFIHSLHDNISIENGINLVLGIHKFSDKILLTFISNQLVMDHMSLRILLDDFTYIYYCLYTKKEINLGSKTNSFSMWSEKLSEIDFSNEITFWNNIESLSVPPLNNSSIKRNLINIRTLTTKCNNTLARRVHSFCQKNNIKEEYLILSALLDSLEYTYKKNNYKILLGNHGRFYNISNLDVSRTIGRFSITYPIVFNVNSNDRTISRVIETINNIPNNGIGYGFLKYKSKNLIDGRHADISFNFMDDFDTAIYNNLFSLTKIQSNNNINSKSYFPYNLKLTVIKKHQDLILNFDYNNLSISEKNIKELNKKINEIIFEYINRG
ncbi:AMP-binding protein [Staphylococcus epidermidis]|jgi:amino acid adenylation domain-containing protein/non-ribosomal peptide synthase protein (TIGR01720 family)|uniref:condensation domain-containing protein n=2 Tax=Staphylococcus TaxID=1279 RepID=UPI00266BE80C|nr:condensation domain-containing protein [Staphylococcus epidermidis]MCG1176233.1 AMP-binding protein [Staphylococcus epidermidis]MCG1339925.1 AMP-binding protein [Staphylococcus epidermidis]MCG1416399.1 AMP-binding protein [Staphylococcus epidermidis]MCG1466479.1 AMP-binding protein [Staphylococcus epidermidis]MCG1489401.1 AMP-binding protein [Staphylococcus epidermidis]